MHFRRFAAFSTLFFVAASASAAPAKFGAVSVAGVSIKNLDRPAATRRLRRALAPRLNSTVTLTDGARFSKQRRKSLGLELDLGWMLARAQKGDRFVPLKLRANQARLILALKRLAPKFSRPMSDARPILMRGRVQLRPAQTGSQLNIGASAPQIAAQVEKSAATRLLKLATRRTAPRLATARLKGINSVLATFSTRFNAGKVKRTNNMRIAIHAINGTLLSPGEEFSLNKTVGERTQARGYRTTVIFKNGYKVAGLGGGVSQVTGTLFNAALLAGLPIVSYRTHSRPVAYLPVGRDATVAWGSFDMKFKNDRKAPLFISYQISSSRVTATLFGPKSTQKASLKVISQKIGPREIKAQLFRTIRQGAKVVKKERVGLSHYNWKQAAWED